MQRQQFEEIFRSALDKAAQNAEAKLTRSIPRDFEIEFHGPGHNRALLDSQTVLEVLYLDPDQFYLVVDVAVMAVGSDRTRVFVRVSGHEPGSWDQTWNDPPGSGPFHQLIAEQIEVAQD